jgi:ligand-binding SRPBCC domain-containing protein
LGEAVGRIITEHWVKADLARVFAFFSDPENLSKLMPAEMAVRLEKLTVRLPGPNNIKKVVESGIDPGRVAGPGSLIEISFRLAPFLPFRGSWIAEILEYEPLSYFLDTQRSGPMRSWRHRHSFHADTRDGVSGTIIRDEVEYELPFGSLGKAVDMIFVERMMQRTFQSRQQQLARLLLD